MEGAKNVFADKLRYALILKGWTLTRLAQELEVTQPNLSKKLKKNNFSESDMRKICAILGVSFELTIETEDGTKI